VIGYEQLRQGQRIAVPKFIAVAILAKLIGLQRPLIRKVGPNRLF
jgi:hypothetical protein